MIQSELMRLFQAAGIFHYDANGVEKTGISFANFAATEIQSELINKMLLDLCLLSWIVVWLSLKVFYQFLRILRAGMFRDRIEFISPGRLPNTVTIEKLKLGVSYSSNPILLKFMDNLGYVERLGRGLPMVYYEVKRI